MRARALAAAVVAATLFTGLPAAAHAATVPSDDLFFPDGTSAPVDGTSNTPAKQAGGGGQTAAGSADAKAPAVDSTTSGSGRELDLARGSRANDLMGWQPSLYQGKWFVAGKEDVRKCIMDRESNFNYRADGGPYDGAYQMSGDLSRGVTYMMAREVKGEMGAEGLAILTALRSLPASKWNRYWQDRAFWTIWHNGDGAGHWRGGGLNCF
jgi:hypothetical protein